MREQKEKKMYIGERKKKQICMRKICGVEDERTKREKDVYWRKKEEASQEVRRALHVHHEMVTKEICKGGNKSELYGHMKNAYRERKGSK